MRTLSVVIPTYNASNFIGQTLGSVFAQTRLPDEVIVADDCSRDDTVKIVGQIAKVSPVPIRVIRLPKNTGGPAKPLNTGIAAAQGELIATLDHDDLMQADRLRLQAAFCERNPTIGLCTGALERVGRGQPSSGGSLSSVPSAICRDGVTGGAIISRTEAHRSILHYGCYVHSCSTMMFPKTVWAQTGGFDERIRTCVDLAFLVQVTRQFDIGSVEAPVGTRFLSDDSLYASSHARILTCDELCSYTMIDRSVLGRELRQYHDRLLSKLYAELAYSGRESGLYWRAASAYLNSLYYRVTESALLGIAKLLPHWLRSQIKRCGAKCEPRSPRNG